MLIDKLGGKKVVKGPGSLKEIAKLPYKRFALITGKSSMVQTGVIQKIEEILSKDNRVFRLHTGIGENPTVAEVLHAVELLSDFEPDVVLAVGGGSAIDAAKVITLLLEYPDLSVNTIRDGRAPNSREKIAFVAVPATSGTASEVTAAAVLTFEEENLKVGLKTPAFIPDLAILDGELTLTMPPHVVAESGMDALTHALESLINKKADDVTRTLSREAALGLIENLWDSYETCDIECRQSVHEYQNMAGVAFQAAGLGMSHGISHAFGGKYGYAHGLLNAVALPYVLTYNSRDEQVAKELKSLSIWLNDDVIQRIQNLNEKLGIPQSFQEMGISEEDYLKDFNMLLDNAMKGSTVRNPIPMTKDEMKKVLDSIYYGKIVF
ncbi:MAG: iron-containing alcohol dehydrogenase [Eubacteriaceae bacterium]|jgi:alcohol dehydrogenase class IV|nr:iron-containing alcohol dehydrogenase [Eubacteriaceae bacterium]